MPRLLAFALIVITLIEPHAVLAAGDEPTHLPTIQESIDRYFRAQSRPPGRRFPPPAPVPKKFPWRTLLIGAGLGCGLGIAWVEGESEGSGHHGKDKLLACDLFGAIGGFAAIAH